ncbi:MAG: hypothetical protein J5U17_12705 [Candidatus Methanoperedens sp.]|nr:hypothetical protein [Candidatus Methanoperedens sp.]
MSEDSKSQTQYKREPAVRLFAQELSQTTVAVSKEQGDKADRFAPSYSYSPTGARINRVFMVGTLTEIDEIGGDSNFIKGRLAKTIRQALPAFVAIVGKPNIYKPKDGGSYTSIRPESVQIVDLKAVEMFTAETAKRTVERISLLKKAISDSNCSEDLKLVIAAYNPNIEDLKNVVRVAIGKISPNTNSQTTTNGDGGGVKTQPPAPDKGVSKDAAKVEPPKDQNVISAHTLLKDMCALSEDGTVGGSVFVDRIVQRKLASADTALTLIKSVMDQGLAYEPKMGRLKAVA